MEFIHHCLRWLLSQKESEVNDTPNYFVHKIVLVVVCWFDDIHRIGISEVADMEVSINLSLEIDRIVPISLISLAIVNNLTSISIKDSPFSIF